MVRRRRFLATVGTVAAGGVAGCTDGGTSTPQALQYRVPALADGTIPRRLTCDGDGVSPRVEIERVPPPTEALALTFTFPQGIAGQTMLWSMWDLPADTDVVPTDVAADPGVDALGGAKQGRNARGDVGYLPVCPPPGEEYEHWFTLYALRRPLGLAAGASADALREELETATLASRLTTATYRRA
ncbi:YbhB/YbcL family Raf kinase inhibitor-like protein [Halorarius halobius]|uniref:YbhB/YbcL family Raf kinase inhibitor-like protein n=1 Tax=Halorarius halobius TaxID=2962671 RepID=UPI0020CD6C4C|nr:YbhB/YbcL family Raf kinase inhibitor-like protein [Halorarius halobius]